MLTRVRLVVPVTIPEGLTEAIPEPLVHIPLASVSFKEVVASTHIGTLPVIIPVSTIGLTVTALVCLLPYPQLLVTV